MTGGNYRRRLFVASSPCHPVGHLCPAAAALAGPPGRPHAGDPVAPAGAVNGGRGVPLAVANDQHVCRVRRDDPGVRG